MSELTKRVISATVLILLFAYLIYDASYLGVIAAAIVFALIFWEFLLLIEQKKNRIIFLCVFIILNIFVPLLLIQLIKFLHQNYNSSIYAFFFFCLSWCIIGIWIFRFNVKKLSDLQVCFLGSLILIPALNSLFIILSNPMYPLIIIGSVAIADTVAYFSGKLFGKRKILPKISPGKSIEGFISALLITPLCLATIANSFDLNIIEFLFFGFFVTLISFVGDITFSLLKRNKGVKESSNLIPGHGGFIDLLDGVIAVLPFFAFSALLVFYLEYDFAWITFASMIN